MGPEGVVGGCIGYQVRPFQVLPWAWYGVKGEAMAAEHTTGIVQKVLREEWLRTCEVGVTVDRWCCFTHT